MSSPQPDRRSNVPQHSLETSSEDTFKILLATDNHIGYNERDPIRGQDSINTFEEILQIAVAHDVDFVLLGGDLFHDNRPSRDSVYKTMALLREYCLGTKPVQFELLSDPDEGRAEGYSFPAINYEDQNLNVGIPVFSIHGNHDDPQGAGPNGALCALDVLSVAGLINYMGKIEISTFKDEGDDAAGIAVRPVLLRKGNTYLGLYGIGNVKDQRMNIELSKGRVRMFMPRNKEDWFNLLIVHQNRVKHGPQSHVAEGLFQEDINLVLWGHEHDCRVVPEPVSGKEYFITQPGSSVATSLADGEAQLKHVALLKVHGREFSLDPIPLRTVRPFVLEELDMQEAAEDEQLDLREPMEITKFLRARVNALIERANDEFATRNAVAVANGEPELPPMLPLVRLKVNTTGVTEMSNPVRFGMEFQGRLANPRDVLVFHRNKKSARSEKVTFEEPELSIDDPNASVSEKISRVRVETLVHEYLSAQELQLLGERGLSDAIKLFVDKDDPHSISGYVNGSLKTMLKGVKTNEKPVDDDLDDDELDEVLMQAKEKQLDEYEQRAKDKKSGKGKGRAVDHDDEDMADAKSVDSMMLDDDDDFEAPPPPKKTTARGKAATTKAATTAAKGKAKAPARGRGKKAVSESDDEVIELGDDSIDEEDEPKPKKTSRAAVLSKTTTKAPAKKAPAKKATASSAKQGTLNLSQPTRTSRVAATKAKSKMVEDDYSDE
ncbi:DNA repair exonuclease [Auriculariales sp. MPI-PUGE-AT-0066]|nr:DNA repair exonuclease [Auriculariales sp. MPI-PUGE-AT-0066]